jgi:hypothetical protein
VSAATDAARAKVQEALEEWVASLPMDGPGDVGLLGDWLAVVSMVAVDADGQPATEYYLVMRDGSMLPHVARGILYQGLEEMDS